MQDFLKQRNYNILVTTDKSFFIAININPSISYILFLNIILIKYRSTFIF